MTEELRPAIDRLIKSGGRLTIEGERVPGGDPVSVVLEQAGSRFGILEVRGRAMLPAADRASTALESAGWTDPNVTNRLGREVRIGPQGAADGPIQRTRTWRVPPALASEIAAEVGSVIAQTARIDFEPLRGLATTTREAPPRQPAATPGSEHTDLTGDTDTGRRVLARTVPAPIRGIVAIAVVALIGSVWVGMIRGSPRATSSAKASASAVAVVQTLVPPTPPQVATSTELLSIRAERAQASTEDKHWLAAAAIDGDPFTAWHAAFGVPQWLEVVLESPETVHEVLMLIAQEDAGTTRHMIQVATPGQALRVVGVVDRQTSDGESIVFRPETPLVNVVRIRIVTMASPSNSGWYEVIVR